MSKQLNLSNEKKSTAQLLVLSAMAIVSLTNVFGVKAAGMSVIFGIAAFLFEKILIKQTFSECGLGIKSIKKVAKTGIWVWIVMPSIINVAVIVIAKAMVPDYIAHVVSRSETMLATNLLPILLLQIVVFALAEEVAWRGYFQKRLQSLLPALPAILLSSTFFSLGHLASGSFLIVAYDLVFVFVNSIIYGVVFGKSNSVWLCTISHAIANVTAVIMLFLL